MTSEAIRVGRICVDFGRDEFRELANELGLFEGDVEELDRCLSRRFRGGAFGRMYMTAELLTGAGRQNWRRSALGEMIPDIYDVETPVMIPSLFKESSRVITHLTLFAERVKDGTIRGWLRSSRATLWLVRCLTDKALAVRHIPVASYSDDEEFAEDDNLNIFEADDGNLAELLVDSDELDQGRGDEATIPDFGEDAEDCWRVELEEDREAFAAQENNEVHRRATAAALEAQAAARDSGLDEIAATCAGEKAFIDELVRAAEEENIADEEATARVLWTAREGLVEFTSAPWQRRSR